ncbi:MAG: TonB-dependent receptor [Chitinophagaceae bacterium]
MKRNTLGLLGLLLFLTVNVFSQEKTGVLTGRVVTTDGSPVPDVVVSLNYKNRSVMTNGEGLFEFARLVSGNYELTISLVGYETQTQAVTVESGRLNTASVVLKVSDRQLAEVVVKSAQRGYKVSKVSNSLRLQSPLIEVPQNIQVVTDKVIHDQQIFDMLEGITRNVSGVTRSEHWDNYANISMRGQQIGSFRNGMNVQMPWGPLVEDMSMVERVEFVKGPAGFMLANGEPTGFYNVVTKKPTGINRGEAGFTMGSYDTYRSTLDLDGRLSKDGKLLYRFNVMGQLKNSFRDFDYTNRYSIVPVLTYRVDDKTSLTAEYTYQYMQMALVGAAYLFSPNGYGDLPRHSTLAEPNLEPTNINDHSVYLTLNHELSSNWKFTTQLAWFDYKQIGSSQWPAYPVGIAPNGDVTRNISIWDARSKSRLGQAFLTGDVSTGAVNHRILTGIDMGYKNYMADWSQFMDIYGYGYDDNGDYVPQPFNIYHPLHGNVPGNALPVFDRSLPLSARADGNIISESYSSVYVQDELRFLRDRLRLTLAGRFTNIKQSAYGTASKDNHFTPRVGISYSVDESVSVYGLYDQAFVPQQGVDTLNRTLVPVTGNNLEAGIKRDWFAGKWNTTASVYQIVRNNVVSSIPGPDYKVLQTGQTKTRGIEFDLRGEITRGLNLTLNYAYTFAEVTDDVDKEKIGGAVPGSGFPDHISNAWLSYRLPHGRLHGLGFSLGYQYQVGRNTWDWGTNTEAKQLPDYFRMDGNISWQNSRYNIALNVNNILDRYLFQGAPYELDNNPATTEYYYQIEPGVNFRLGFGYKF